MVVFGACAFETWRCGSRWVETSSVISRNVKSGLAWNLKLQVLSLPLTILTFFWEVIDFFFLLLLMFLSSSSVQALRL